MKSFVDHGHKFSLYSYDNKLDVPEGVELKDASAIMPRDEVFCYSLGPGRGSVAAFANKFRYALLHQLGGWWVDMDVVCLSKNFPDTECFFAFEEGERVNNAILRFPKGHPAMALCLERANEAGRNIVWGTTGPKLLTSVLSEMDLLNLAQSISSCYAIEWHEYLFFFDPKKRKEVEDRTRSSLAAHLWNEMIRRIGLNKQQAPPTDSFLDVVAKQHGIEFPEGRISALYIYYLYAYIRIQGFIIYRKREFQEGRNPFMKRN